MVPKKQRVAPTNDNASLIADRPPTSRRTIFSHGVVPDRLPAKVRRYSVSRRSTPARIDVAQRAGTRRRLTLEGVSEATAVALLEAWEAQAAHGGIQRDAAYWDAA
jgi:hypothetical protein